MKAVTNESGLTLTILVGDFDHLDPQIFLGGDDRNPTWEEYLNDFKEEYKSHVELLRKAIEENHLIGTTGQEASDLTFQFSDGETWGYSWRGWGDLMQAIVGKKEGYMAYYM